MYTLQTVSKSYHHQSSELWHIKFHWQMVLRIILVVQSQHQIWIFSSLSWRTSFYNISLKYVDASKMLHTKFTGDVAFITVNVNKSYPKLVGFIHYSASHSCTTLQVTAEDVREKNTFKGDMRGQFLTELSPLSVCWELLQQRRTQNYFKCSWLKREPVGVVLLQVRMIVECFRFRL